MADPDIMYHDLMRGQRCGCGKRAVGYATWVLANGQRRTRVYCDGHLAPAMADYRCCESMRVEALTQESAR